MKKNDMQENHIEALDRMFPNGYMIVYSQPNNNVRMSYYNPHKAQLIYDVYDLIKNEISKE
jgi:hypothetical protein